LQANRVVLVQRRAVRTAHVDEHRDVALRAPARVAHLDGRGDRPARAPHHDRTRHTHVAIAPDLQRPGSLHRVTTLSGDPRALLRRALTRRQARRSDQDNSCDSHLHPKAPAT
jgi:hypothetical protein